MILNPIPLEILTAILLGDKLLIDPPFPKQDAFVGDDSRFIVAQCSRRAGKTSALALKFFKAMERHPGALCVYISLTRESAKNIMWPVLQEQARKLGVKARFREADLSVQIPNGARLKLFGAKMSNFKERLKGIKTPAAAVDEIQDFGTHLQSLIDDVLTPTLTDYHDSWLALTGTPGPVPQGYFYEVAKEHKYGYSHHEWTILENPYLPNANKFIRELIVKNGWEDDNPTLLREWRNKWALDRQSLVIHYDAEKNHYEYLPMLSRGQWYYIMGIDLGYKDADAISILGWNESSSQIYLVDEVVTRTQDITALSQQIAALYKKYDISKTVIDTGGLGKKIAEELTRRYSIPCIAADKARKFENIALLNTWLRLGNFKAKESSLFAREAFQLQIDWDHSTPDKIKIKDTFHSDIIDAVLYAFRESPAYTYQTPIPKPKYGSPEYYKEEVDEMEKFAIEKAIRLQREQEGSHEDIGDNFFQGG